MLLYIHIPFCDSKCSYCAFNSYTTLNRLKDAYMQALYQQLCYDLNRFEIQPLSIKTLFIGGGTPSTLPAQAYSEIFQTLRPYFTKDVEITFEANPNSADMSWLEGINALGATRVSFGVQSFDPKKLKHLNRAHSKEDALKAVFNAHSIGFQHISIDIIYNTLYDTKAFLEKEFEIIKTLPIDHLSTYSLIIEDNTPFAQTPEISVEREESYGEIKTLIESLGLPQYEVANFGRYHCRHNLGYWRYEPYMGVGAGAYGTINQKRYTPHHDVNAYISDPLFSTEEALLPHEIKMEKVLLGLRCKEGFEKALLNPAESLRLEHLLEEEKLFVDSGCVYNPNFFIADEIALYLLD